MKIAVAIMIVLATSAVADAQMDSGQYPSFLPWVTTDQIIQQDQRQLNQQQPQRLSPRNRQFLSPMGQAQYPQYDSLTINRYLMGSPGTHYRVRPYVRQPYYGPTIRD